MKKIILQPQVHSAISMCRATVNLKYFALTATLFLQAPPFVDSVSNC